VGVDWNWNWNVGAKEGQAKQMRLERERERERDKRQKGRAQCPERGLPPVCLSVLSVPLSIATPMPRPCHPCQSMPTNPSPISIDVSSYRLLIYVGSNADMI
jgi:hypothetical protein